MNKVSTSLIIHGMALLHGAVAWLCLYFGIADTLILTVLTMTMTLLLCLKEELPIGLSSIIIVLVNVFGFLMGNWGARLLVHFFSSDVLPRVLSTVITTELLGWGQVLFLHVFPAVRHSRESWREDVGWLVAAVAIVFMLRIGINLLISRETTSTQTVLVIVEVGVFCLAFVIYFAARMRDQAALEREKTHQAEFSYMTLKQQVNPHFLFNSLNILDSLVQENTREDASRYIHKLAGIYRYMLQHEGEDLVRLSDEVEFARMYTDLLKVRFPEGFSVEMDIPEEDLRRFIVPCSLQLLLENVTKHNAILPDSPLSVRIASDGEAITVSNNIIPRLSPSPSTGLGQKYIVRQYKDKTSKEVVIFSDGKRYSVTVPLL